MTAIERFLILMPVIAGGLFALAVPFEHDLYRDGTIGARGAIGIELAIFLVFWVSVIVALRIAVRNAVNKRWILALAAVLSFAAGLVLLVYGLTSGAALLYAT